MSEIQNYSQNSRHLVKEFLLPTPLSIFLYLFFGACIQIALSSSLVWKMIQGELLTNTNSTVLSGWLSTFNEKFATPFVWLFWLLMGSVVYMAFWFVENVIVKLHEDVEDAESVAGESARRGYWSGAISRYVSFAVIVVVLITYVLTVFKFIVPSLVVLFANGLISLPNVRYITDMVVAVMITATILYVGVLISRAFVYFWKSLKSVEE